MPPSRTPATAQDGPDPTPAWRSRSARELLAQQATGIERFEQARLHAERAATLAARSREMRMDAARRVEVLRRQHEALLERAQQRHRLSGEVLGDVAPRTVLLAHRSGWFVDQVSSVLSARGLVVAGHVENGAEAIGLAVAEQPDLLLVEDTLAMVSGEEVVRDVLRFSPHTRVVAQVAHEGRVRPLLEAGAATACTRRVPPADVAAALCRLLTA